MVGALLLGFVVGMKHALEADHVAAVATLATRSASLGERVKLAGMWGAGHAGTLLLLGGAALGLGLSLPDPVARMLEGAVGIMLIVLGIDVLRRLRSRGVHLHWHRHGDGPAHLHAHAHAEPGAAERGVHAHAHPTRLLPRALVVGSVHGLAGSGALVVLSLELARSTAHALLYLAAFGLGSIAGMAALSLVISLPLRGASARLGAAWHVVEGALAVVTIGLGCWMAGLLLRA
jgi:hypothetical protein